jgi:hypothetical protein
MNARNGSCVLAGLLWAVTAGVLWADVKPVAVATVSPLTDAGFGTAADLTGDTAVITTSGGAAGVNSLGTLLTHVYTRDAGTGAWSMARQLGAMLAAGEQIGNYGWSAAVDGDTVAVGAPVLFTPSPVDGYDGRVFIHRRNAGGAGAWGRVKLLTGRVGTAVKLGFGERLALSGDTLAVRTPGNRLERSSVRVFVRNQGGSEQWGEVATIPNPDTTGGGGAFDLNDDSFAEAMALHGDRLVCTLPSGAGAAQGVYLYERNLGGANAWGLARHFPVPAVPGARLLGKAVAMEGDRLMVSGVAEVGGSLTTRVWWVVRNASGTWEEEGAHSTSDSAVSGFGQSVALRGDWSAVMAKRTLSATQARREVYLYQRLAIGWSLRAVLPGPTFEEESASGSTIPSDLSPEFEAAFRLLALARSLAPRNKPPLALGGDALLHQSATGASGTTGGLTVSERLPDGTGYGAAAVLRPSVPASENFGEVISASGNWLAVGDPDDDEGAIDSGAVWVFGRNTTSADQWILFSKIKAPVPRTGAHFGASVSIVGHRFDYTLAVGAPEDTVAAVGCGAVYTFGRFGNGQIIAPLSPTANQAFGRSVAMTPLRNTAGSLIGVRLVAGASGHDLPGAVNAGKAEVHEFLTGASAWFSARTLTAADAAANDAFGWSVAIDGDTVAVGALTAGANGAAYVFQRGTGAAHDYPQVKKVLPGDGSSGLFGHALALEGDTLVGGTLSLTSGAVFVYDRSQGGANQWGLVKKLRPAAPGGTGDGFGLSVALYGELILVGAQGDDVGATSNGAAWLFQRHRGGTNQWGIAARLAPATGDASRLYGQAVAIANDTLVLGAPNDDDAGSDVGAAYLLRAGSYEFWAETHSFHTLPAGLELPEADPDFDGEPNLLEFMLGTNPRQSASRSQPTLVFDAGTRRLSIRFDKPAYSLAGLGIEAEGRSTTSGSFSFSNAEVTEDSATVFSAQWRGVPPEGALMRVRATYPRW